MVAYNKNNLPMGPSRLPPYAYPAGRAAPRSSGGSAASALDSYYASPRGMDPSSLYPDTALALYANAATGNGIGLGGGTPAPVPASGWVGWKPPTASPGVSMPSYDPNNPYADYSGVDYGTTDPGMGGLGAALGVGAPPPQQGGLMGLLSGIVRRKMFEGPKAQGNAAYREQAKSTAPLSGGQSGPALSPEALAAYNAQPRRKAW